MSVRELRQATREFEAAVRTARNPVRDATRSLASIKDAVDTIEWALKADDMPAAFMMYKMLQDAMQDLQTPMLALKPPGMR